MRRPAPLPPTVDPAGFTVAAARAHGLREGRLRSSDLTAPFYGVRVAGAVSSLTDRARALAARITPDQYFSHTTAAVLLGLRMPEGFREDTLHVTSVRPHRGPRLTGVFGHESAAAAIQRIGGLPVLNPIDVWMQLSASFTLDDLVVMGDGLVRRRAPLATMDQLRTAVQGYHGRGARRLRAALDLVRPGTDSSRETLLRLIVIRARFPAPEVNGVIRNAYGADIAHGDLVFRAYRTILEYEGRQHAEDAAQFAIDIARLDQLMDDGWRVIRVDKALMSTRATLLAKIDRALRRGGWVPS